MGRREPKRKIPPYELLHGDCLELIKQLPDNSIDSVCSDPPAAHVAAGGRL